MRIDVPGGSDDVRCQPTFGRAPIHSAAATTPRDHRVLRLASAESTMSYYEEKDLDEYDVTLKPSPTDDDTHHTHPSPSSIVHGSPSGSTLQPETTNNSSSGLAMAEEGRGTTVPAMGRE